MCGGDFYEGKFLQDKILMLVCKWLLLVAQKREREKEVIVCEWENMFCEQNVRLTEIEKEIVCT